MRSALAAAVAQSSRAQRLLAFVGLSLSEILLTSFVFNFRTTLPEWSNPVAYVKCLAQGTSLAVLIFFLIVGHKRIEIVQAWSHTARDSQQAQRRYH